MVSQDISMERETIKLSLLNRIDEVFSRSSIAKDSDLRHLHCILCGKPWNNVLTI